MPHPNYAALQNSNLNPFLFADVGTQLNGAALTMLSVLARLGVDPWDEAERWAKLPRPLAITHLITAIADIPLCRQSEAEIRAVAGRLVMLLPAQQGLSGLNSAAFPKRTAVRAFGASLGVMDMPRWLPMVLLALALVIGSALNLLHTPSSGASSSATTQTTAHAIAVPE